MSDRTVFVSTAGGWVSFDNGATINRAVAGELSITRGGHEVGFFKKKAWNGYVYVEADDMKPFSELVGQLAAKKMRETPGGMIL